jgi:hypothetical protein
LEFCNCDFGSGSGSINLNQFLADLLLPKMMKSWLAKANPSASVDKLGDVDSNAPGSSKRKASDDPIPTNTKLRKVEPQTVDYKEFVLILHPCGSTLRVLVTLLEIAEQALSLNRKNRIPPSSRSMDQSILPWRELPCIRAGIGALHLNSLNPTLFR